MRVLSQNTQAILLLTAPLIAGRNGPSTELLSQNEYNDFARKLKNEEWVPADLISPESASVIDKCHGDISVERLKLLLARGFLLSQVVVRWHSRGIWVVSRDDDVRYPKQLKRSLGIDRPAILYGCGEIELLNTAGLALVGSDTGFEQATYANEIARMAVANNTSVITGGAKGFDQTVMNHVLEFGGTAVCVLADHLEDAALDSEHREHLMGGKLVLVSPNDPLVRPSQETKTLRNRVIYGLAGATLVLGFDRHKNDAFKSAIEALQRNKPNNIFFRSTGVKSRGHNALDMAGAAPWPNPADCDTFHGIFKEKTNGAANTPIESPPPLLTGALVVEAVTLLDQPIGLDSPPLSGSVAPIKRKPRTKRKNPPLDEPNPSTQGGLFE